MVSRIPIAVDRERGQRKAMMKTIPDGTIVDLATYYSSPK